MIKTPHESNQNNSQKHFEYRNKSLTINDMN